MRTYQVGSVLYLESGSANDSARIGVETAWGGTIVEASVNGTNFVNRHDTGREVQPAFRDGNREGWNPTLGGDGWNQGTPTISWSVGPTSLYTKAQPLLWEPDKNGGGFGLPVAGDLIVEQAITAVVNEPHTFKVHYKVVHLGNDLHANTGSQEFPAVYTNRDYHRFIYYDGTAPWTNGAVSEYAFAPYTGSPQLYVPERWGALVDANNLGLTAFVPDQYPYVIGFAAPDTGGGTATDNYTNYFAMLGELTIGPGFVLEADVYLIPGDYVSARKTVYRLHRMLGMADIFAPAGATDAPSSGNELTGSTNVSGWTLDDHGVATVEVLMDGTSDGIATYGDARPDVGQTFPHAPTNIGYQYLLDTTKFTNGRHVLNVRCTDTSGNVAILPDVVVNFAN
ncbi:MAG: Ig-like domain-containing protein [Steroidobacterales bacterium]